MALELADPDAGMTPRIDLARHTVLVTGGAGFLGSFVVERLRQRGCRKIVLPRSAQYDLVDGRAVERLFRENQPSIVIHLAAVVGGIGANLAHPGEFFYKNIMMGVQVIEKARRRQVSKTVIAGTICAYPKFTPVPFREKEPTCAPGPRRSLCNLSCHGG